MRPVTPTLIITAHAYKSVALMQPSQH